MKRSIIAAMVVSAASILSGSSPMATQNWVREYVSTNTEYRTSEESPAFGLKGATATRRVNGSNYVLRLKWIASKNPAIRIVRSDYSGMAPGTDFVLDDFGNYCNNTNSACTTVSVHPVVSGWTLSGNVRREIYSEGGVTVTNVVGDVTNKVTTSRLVFEMGGEVYGGARNEHGEYECASMAGNHYERIVFRSVMVSDDRKRACLAPVSAPVSMIDLLFPSAAAEWVLNGEKVYKQGSNTEWHEHAEWHYSEGNPTLWLGASFDGGSYDVMFYGEVDVGFPDYGSHRCDFTANAVDYGLIISQLQDAVKDYYSDDPFMADITVDMLLNGVFNVSLVDQVMRLNNELSSGDSCREGEDEEPEDKPEPKPVPSPDPEPVPGCNHDNVRSSPTAGGCRWICLNCPTVVVRTDVHEFHKGDSHCAVCTKGCWGRQVPCGYCSPNPADHDFDTRRWGDQRGCRCFFGATHRSHSGWIPEDPEHPWEWDDRDHWRNEVCGHCGWKNTNPLRGPHSPVRSGEYEPSEDGHYPIYECGVKCGWIETGSEMEPHRPKGEGGWCFNQAVHLKEGTCMDCGFSGLVAEEGAHGDMLWDPLWTPDPDNPGNHRKIGMCPTLCGYQETNSVAHTTPHEQGTPVYVGEVDGYDCHEKTEICPDCRALLAWTTNRCDSVEPVVVFGPPGGKDSMECGECHHSRQVDHSWMRSPDIHYCSQRGQIHLYGPHVWNFPDPPHRCLVCGYEEGDPRDPREIVLVEVRCEHCDCRATYCHYADEEGAEWLSDTNCAYWDDSSRSCACGKCGVHGMECLCCLTKRVLDIVDPFIPPERYLDGFSGSVFLEKADASGVEMVGESGFRGAFSGSLKLGEADFSSLTNCGDRAFEEAFAGCTALTNVDVSSMWGPLSAVSSSNAFKSAFAGCSSLKANFQLMFSNADGMGSLGTNTFERAFAGTATETSMVVAGSDCAWDDFNSPGCFRYAYANCKSLRTISIGLPIIPPEPGQGMYYGICDGCDNLLEVIIHGDNAQSITNAIGVPPNGYCEYVIVTDDIQRWKNRNPGIADRIRAAR